MILLVVSTFVVSLILIIITFSIVKKNQTDYFNGQRNIFVNDLKLKQATDKHNSTTKGYDTNTLAIVSQNLGHNRIDVVYSNYLSRF
mgnify:CR=1 FL=1